MSIFGSIWSAIVGHGSGAATASADSLPSFGSKPATPAASPTTTAAATTPSPAAAKPAAPAAGGVSGGGAPAAAAPAGSVDVTAILDKLAAASAQKLNWRTSIVDLMKLLNLDSSLTARKQLAAELHYTGNTQDSAAMNIWLHKQVMTKLAENGGVVPADLKH